MTKNKKEQSHSGALNGKAEVDSSKKSPNSQQLFQPSDEEIENKLAKAKNINKNIMKDTHPEEYKKIRQEEIDK